MAKPPPKTVAALTQTLAESQFLSSGPEDGELSVGSEAFGKGGIGVDSECDLELGRPGMGHQGLLTAPNEAMRR
jgi:hypothetical protein